MLDTQAVTNELLFWLAWLLSAGIMAVAYSLLWRRPKSKRALWYLMALVVLVPIWLAAMLAFGHNSPMEDSGRLALAVLALVAAAGTAAGVAASAIAYRRAKGPLTKRCGA